MLNILIVLKLTILLNAAPLNINKNVFPETKTDSIIQVNGKVLNAQTLLPIKAKIVLERLPNSNNIIVSNSELNTGDYKVHVFSEEKYSIEVRADGYATYRGIMIVHPDSVEDLVQDIYLVPSVVGQILRMNKLFFQQSSAQFTDNSIEELNSLLLLLNENPSMVVQLEGHTDFRGNAKLNMKLSQDRVEEVKKYLVKKGISKSRVKVKAFGGSTPLTTENTEEAQQMNRRVEVRILKN